jgi:predicted O-linked N-acetylglucosamine transferase (SPINDLY family)
MRHEILNNFDCPRILHGKDETKSTEIIKLDELDILVDLNGLTTLSKIGLLKHRLAPIQISYLGFPGTVGGRFIDYIIADKYVIPDSHLPYYKEKIIRIKKTYQVNDYDLQSIVKIKKRNEYGLTDQEFVLGMFNNANKISHGAWSTWMNLLKELPHAILWLLQPNPLAQKNLMDLAKLQGVDQRRIKFAGYLPRNEHFGRLAVCDLILDPWPYGGHTTTSDALFMGVPVVAKEGSNFASRVSGSLLMAAGLPGWIVPDELSYFNAICNLYKDREPLIATKK